MKRTYDKLVRDNIIDIIKKDGKTCKYEILDDKDYEHYLLKKLYEELAEFSDVLDIEELADLQEVINAFVKQKGLTLEEFHTLVNKKAKERGRFDKRILLKEVDDEE